MQPRLSARLRDERWLPGYVAVARNARYWGLPKAREPGLPTDRLAEVLKPQLCSLQARQEARGSAIELLGKLVDGAGVLLD